MDTTVINVNTNLYRQVADYARNHKTNFIINPIY